jgi:hypothetical protein
MSSAASGGAAAAPQSPGAPPRPRKGPIRRLLGWVGYRIPRETDEERTESGFAADIRFGAAYFVAACLLGAAFAIFWLWMTRSEPIQPGGDPSTWIATSYYFIGVPAPTGVAPLAYPPAAFPFVGIAVWAGGGPLVGGRIFMATMIALLGPAGYLFGRAVLQRPSLALLSAGLLIAEPDFQQLYYFGGFPNMFAYLFLLLALAYLLRWLRSRRPSHLFVFWVSVTLVVLSHSLTAAILAGTVALLLVALLLLRRLPRGFLLSRAGAAGAAILGVGTVAYYGGTAVLGVQHPSYLSSSSLGGAKNALIPTVLRPFYLDTIVGALEHQTVTISVDQALAFIVITSLIVLGLFLLLFWKRPTWLTLPWLVLAGSFLTVFAGTLAGYVENIPVDYRRFPYFLYGPVIVTVLLFVDTGLTLAMRPPSVQRLPAPAAPHLRVRVRRPLRWRGWVEPILLAVCVVAILASAQYYTLPAAEGYEAYFTEYGHDQQFVNAMQALVATGIAGNIMSTTAEVAHWPSTLTSRTTYDPSAFGANSYANSLVVQGETTGLVLANRFTVDNGLVGGSLPGIMPGDFNASPVFGAFTQNVYQPILQFPTPSFEVGLVGGPLELFVPPGTGAPPVTSVDGGTGYSINFSAPGAILTETVVAVPQTTTVNVTFAVQQSGPAALTFLQVRAGDTPGVIGIIGNGTMPGSFDWYSNTTYGNFTTVGTAAPSSSLSKVIPANLTTGAAAQAVLRAAAPNQTLGVPSLSFTLSLSVPSADNEAVGLPTWLNADQVWQNLSVRFLLLFNGSVQSRPLTESYYQTEYGAALVAWQGPYRVMVLPQPLAGPPWPIPTG